MALLSFDIPTIASGALADRLSLCQTALWGIMIAVLVLFVRDKRQMARVGLWSVALSFVGTALAAYGTFSGVQGAAAPVAADFVVGAVLFFAGIIEMYRHEILKFEIPFGNSEGVVFRWFRRSTLPLLAFASAIVQPPCAAGPFSLLTQALSVRPGQLIEAYLLLYVFFLFLPYLLLVCLWYGVLSIPGVEHVKSRHRLAIRLAVGALTTIIGALLLWKTHAITLLPGIANIGS